MIEIRKKIWNALSTEEQNRIRESYRKSKRLYDEKRDGYSNGEYHTFEYIFGIENLTC